MRKSRFSDEQIAGVLAESKAGAPTQDLCRRHGISLHTFYAWRKKFGGMSGTDVRRTKELEATVSRLERIVARQALELQASKEIIKGKW